MAEVCKSSGLEDSRTVLPPSDVTILQTVADGDHAAILRHLLKKPLSQAAIREVLPMASGTASKQLGALESRKLVARRRSHGEYVLAAPRETERLLQAAADLAAALSRQQADVDEAHARTLRTEALGRSRSRTKPGSHS
jgi:DNA-binding HxlR family transcriptional regulator